MRFDGYVASVPLLGHKEAAASIVKALLEQREEAGGCGGSFQIAPHRGRRQYENAEAIVDLDSKRTEAVIRWGGNQNAPLLVDAMGPSAPAIASWLRTDYPDHRPTRQDVACDFDLGEPGLFDRVFSEACEIGKSVIPKPIFPEVAGKWHGGVEGRTAYFGSIASVSQLVIYEKGLQLLGQGYDVSPTIVRLEVRCRPPRDARPDFAQKTERQIFNVSPIAPQVLATLDGSVPERTRVGSKPPPAIERTIAHLMRMYGPTLDTFVNDRHKGVWGSAWLEMLDIQDGWEERRSRRKKAA